MLKVLVPTVVSLLLAGAALAQQDLPSGDKLNARSAQGAFDQIANTSFMAPAVKALQQHQPEQYGRLREDFLKAARDQGVRAAVRNVSTGLTQAVSAARPRLAGASEDALNDLLEAEVQALRTLRDESPDACVAFAETLLPPQNAAPSETASEEIFQAMALAIRAAASARDDGAARQMSPEDRGLLRLDSENLRIAGQGGATGRCQSYVTLMGTALAQPPSRSARMYAVLLRESFGGAPRS